MGTQREYPIDPNWLSGDSGYNEERNWLQAALQNAAPVHGRYATDTERMLSERPDGIHASNTPTLEAMLGIKEVLGSAIEALEPEERWIAERLLIERLSLRKAGAILGCPKTTLARRRDTIRGKIVNAIAGHPAIRQWLGQTEESLLFYGKTLSDHTH